MAIESLGKYQVHLFAYEVPGTAKWDAFLSIFRFDDLVEDFVCVVEKDPVSASPWNSYDEAIEAARRHANVMIKALEQ
jgi:hypothetical protein